MVEVDTVGNKLVVALVFDHRVDQLGRMRLLVFVAAGLVVVACAIRVGHSSSG